MSEMRRQQNRRGKLPASQIPKEAMRSFTAQSARPKDSRRKCFPVACGPLSFVLLSPCGTRPPRHQSAPGFVIVRVCARLFTIRIVTRLTLAGPQRPKLKNRF
eukprot:1162328-Prymnesium_polylepis.1